MSAQQPDLVPLRVPGGWQIQHNIFAEADPLVEDGEFVNSYLFIQDLLYFRTGEQLPEDAALHISLGWYPDEEIDGHFQLELLKGDAPEALDLYDSRSYADVRAVLERWLADGAAGSGQGAELMPLRIPTGWAVLQNHLVDAERPGAVSSAAPLLHLAKLSATSNPPEFELTLGWSPPTYWLELLHADTGAIVKRREERDRAAIRQALEQWLQIVYTFQGGRIKPDALA
jgi:hypothetical protein